MRKFLLAITLATLAACSAKIDSGASPEGVFQKETRPLPESSGPLAGTVDGKPWTIGGAVAQFTDGKYSITIAGQGVALSCTNWFPMAPHIGLIVPPGKGSYPYEGQGGLLVNFNFPYTTANGGGSDNVLGSKSLINIEEPAQGRLNGYVAAISADGLNHSYSIAGSFSAVVCNGPAAPLSIELKRSPAFAVAYSEALKRGDGSYEVRFMNKTPTQKCNSWSAWMMTETPIKYAWIRMPGSASGFSIARGSMEYGDQGVSSGWSSDYFTGTGSVVSISADEIEFSVDATSPTQVGVTAAGTARVKICK